MNFNNRAILSHQYYTYINVSAAKLRIYSRLAIFIKYHKLKFRK